MATWRRFMDFVLYILIGVACVTAPVLWAVHQARVGGSSQLPLKWFALAGILTTGFWYPIKHSRHKWGRPQFWVAAGGLAAVQLVVGYIAMSRIDRFPLIYLPLLGPANCVAVAMCLEYVGTGHEGRA